MRAVMQTPPRYLVSEWAERFRYLSREYSAQPGRYSLGIVPYAKEPMDCANNKTVRSVVLMWAAQTTKTTVLENVCGYFIHAEPSPILLVQPSVEMAQAWSKERFNATCRDTPVLRELVTEQKSRTSENTIQLKTFPGGNLAIIGSNAPSGLAGRPRRVVLLDEVDRYPASAGTEGDPVSLALRRTESFWNSVAYLTSTPTVKGFSRIEAEFEQTDKRHWFVPCPACRESQILKWSQVKWESGNPPGAWYQCEKCEARWTDAERIAAIKEGEWRATVPFNGKRGYFLNGIYSPFRAKRGFASRLHQMAAEFLEAKAGGHETLKTWTNTFLAETWEDETERLDVQSLLRGEKYTPQTLPNAVVVVVGGADVQKDRIELEWIGYGPEMESWGIEIAKIYGDTERPEIWQKLTLELTRTFKRADGAVLSPLAFAIDIHYRPQQVRDWAARHGTRVAVLPIVGSGRLQSTLVVDHFNKSWRQRTWSISTDPAKDTIFSRLQIKEPGPRYCHFPDGYGYSDQWFAQLTSERAVTRYQHGRPKRIYELTSGTRNEALDMRVYILGALDAMKITPQTLTEMRVQPEQKNERPQPSRAAWQSGWKL
jgi:phage terminase large subunit GpA-like protein